MNLAEWLSRAPRSAVQEQLTLVTALALAVEEGHRAGAQFAGWSPSKIAIRGEGLDLSPLDAAKSPAEHDAYTAPEVADGGAHSKRSDVYSAGVILYEILAGAHPFGGVGVQQQQVAPRPLRELRPDLSQDLADAVTACLDRDPDWRAPDLSYVLQVARGLRAKGPTGARQGLGPAFGARPASVSKMSLVLVGVAIAIIAGAAAFWELRARPTGPSGSDRSAPAPADVKPEPATPISAPPATTPMPPARAASPQTAPTQSAPTPPPQPLATPASTTLPNATDSRTLGPSPAVAPTAPPAVRPTVPPAITPAPASTLAASPSAPTPPPAATPAPTVVASGTPDSLSLDQPAVLRSLTPLKIRRGLKGLLDVRGDHLRAEDQVTISKQKGRGDPSDVLPLRKKLVDSTLLQVLVNVAPNAPTGLYALVVVDAQGRSSNALTLEVTQ